MLNIILCGGTGSRLWPLSRELQPKQFINLIGKKSLLQETALGNKRFCSHLIVVCNSDHHFLAQKQLKEISITPQKYILEPAPKNTAPAICFALFAVDPDEILLITPADHHIDYSAEYERSIEEARKFASEGFLTVFGISPTSPEIGYGYIEVYKNSVKKFHEKPSLETAIQYLVEGNFYWNSGMICAKASVLKELIQKHSPDIYKKSKEAFDATVSVDKNTLQIPLDRMNQIPSNSIDYALLEKEKDLKVIIGKFSWSDLGSFDSLFSHLPKDSSGNAISLTQKFSSMGSKNNLVIGGNRMISTIDIENLVIVDTDDALLISKLGSTQKVKEILMQLKKREGSSLHRSHLEEMRPWGNFTVLESGENYKVKRLVVHPGKRLSLQKHHHRFEHWVVVAGNPIVTIGEIKQTLHPNQSVYIPKGEIHRIENPPEAGCDAVIIEVQFGEILSEEDIIRIQDDFARCGL